MKFVYTANVLTIKTTGTGNCGVPAGTLQFPVPIVFMVKTFAVKSIVDGPFGWTMWKHFILPTLFELPYSWLLRSSAFLASMHGFVFYCFGTRRQQILMTKSWCFSYQGVPQFLAFHSVQFANFWIIQSTMHSGQKGISLTKTNFFNFTIWQGN